MCYKQLRYLEQLISFLYKMKLCAASCVFLMFFTLIQDISSCKYDRFLIFRCSSCCSMVKEHLKRPSICLFATFFLGGGNLHDYGSIVGTHCYTTVKTKVIVIFKGFYPLPLELKHVHLDGSLMFIYPIFSLLSL